jgi:hypothetical protein
VQIALPDGRILATYHRKGPDGAPEIELDPLSKTLTVREASPARGVRSKTTPGVLAA